MAYDYKLEFMSYILNHLVTLEVGCITCEVEIFRLS